jgi:hypothetical protein
MPNSLKAMVICDNIMLTIYDNDMGWMIGEEQDGEKKLLRFEKVGPWIDESQAEIPR